MNSYCQKQFSTYDAQVHSRRRQQELRLRQRELRAGLLEVMRQQNLKNVQVQAPDGSRLQVKISRYPVPRVITQDVLDEARIDWSAAFLLTVEEQVAHVVAEIKKVARDTRPYVDVVVCGKRSRDRLQLVGGNGGKGGNGGNGGNGGAVRAGAVAQNTARKTLGAAGGTGANGNNDGNNDDDDDDADGYEAKEPFAQDPFAHAVLQLATYKQEMSRETDALKKLVGEKQCKEDAAAVLQEMAAVDVRKKTVNLRSTDGRVHKFVVERKVEHRRPAVTVKVITAAVKAALVENARRPRSPEAIKQFILDVIADATRPVPHESLHFRSAEKAGGMTAALDDDDGEGYYGGNNGDGGDEEEDDRKEYE